jgi:hypothetical protein
MSTQLLQTDPTAQVCQRVVDDLSQACGVRDFAVRFWDGTTWEGEPGAVSFTLILKHPGALRRMLWPPHKPSLGEAYIYDDFDLHGDMSAFFRFLDALLQQRWSLREQIALGWRLFWLPGGARPSAVMRGAKLSGRMHSPERDRQAISFHYDLSNDFFALWLDRRMVYTCGYFHNADDDIDAAQEQKLEHVCRKLRLRPGEQFLDVGCGWGGLVMYAAEHFGVSAMGVTLSARQAELARNVSARPVCKTAAASNAAITARFQRAPSTRSPASASWSTWGRLGCPPSLKAFGGCCGRAAYFSTTASRSPVRSCRACTNSPSAMSSLTANYYP